MLSSFTEKRAHRLVLLAESLLKPECNARNQFRAAVNALSSPQRRREGVPDAASEISALGTSPCA